MGGSISGECLRGEGVVGWSGGVFASCMPLVQLSDNACSGWPQFALPHHWLNVFCQSTATSEVVKRGWSRLFTAV